MHISESKNKEPPEGSMFQKLVREEGGAGTKGREDVGKGQTAGRAGICSSGTGFTEDSETI